MRVKRHTYHLFLKLTEKHCKVYNRMCSLGVLTVSVITVAICGKVTRHFEANSQVIIRLLTNVWTDKLIKTGRYPTPQSNYH